MQCPNCNAPLDNDSVFCGNCGNQITPLQAQGATVVDATEMTLRLDDNKRNPGWSNYGSQQRPLPQTTPPPSRSYVPLPDRPGQGNTPPSLPFSPPIPSPSRPSRNNTRRNIFLAVIAVLLVASVSAGVVALLRNKSSNTGGSTAGAAAGASGLVSFSDSQNGQGHTDTLKISINGLNAPAAGSQYDAWLVNEESEQTLALGKLEAQDQAFSLGFTHAGTNLLGAGNKLEITLEQGDVKLPTGKVVLAGTFPPEAFIHVRHLLFSFPTTPGKVGLVVGLRDQVQQLNAQVLLLQSVSASHNTVAIQCAAQSIIDITEGAKGPHALPLDSTCTNQNITVTGDGFGVLGSNGYVAGVAAHASLAATQADSTSNIKVHAGHVEIAMSNVKGWVTTVDHDARNLLANPKDTTKIQEMVTLSNQALNGVDINGDERVDPVPGEAGAIVGYNHAQLMAMLPLVPAA